MNAQRLGKFACWAAALAVGVSFHLFEQALGDPDRRVRTYSDMALGYVRGDAVEALIQLLESSPDAALRQIEDGSSSHFDFIDSQYAAWPLMR